MLRTAATLTVLIFITAPGIHLLKSHKYEQLSVHQLFLPSFIELISFPVLGVRTQGHGDEASAPLLDYIPTPPKLLYCYLLNSNAKFLCKSVLKHPYPWVVIKKNSETLG